MAEIINMPKLGFDMAEGTLIRWIILEGDQVSRGAVLAEIETDKATVEVEAVQEGVMKRHLVSEGTVVPVNAPIAVIGAVDEEINLTALLGESAAGNIDISQKPVEANVSAASVVEKVSPPDAVQSSSDLPGGVRASPIARRMAEDIGLDLKLVQGSGPGGRITKKDIENYHPSPPKSAVPAPVSLPETKPGVPAFQPLPYQPSLLAPAPESVTVPLNKLRAIIGKRMVDAKQQVPHFYLTHEYDVRTLLDLRKEVNSLIPDDQKISVNDFVIKAAALGLRQFPNLRASLLGDQIIQHGNINIGVAVAVDGGLLTVVCKDADRKPLRQIAMEVRAMANRARAGKVRPDDIEGSTFSVSNLGMFSVESFIAIINPPEAAILAVGSANQVPVVEDGTITTGWRMKATISVDHRVSDGAEAARYLQALESLIEKPLSLVI